MANVLSQGNASQAPSWTAAVNGDSAYQVIPTPALQLMPDDYFNYPADALSGASVADKILFVPFRAGTTRTMSELKIITGTATTKLRMGLYASVAFLPGGAPLYSGAEITLTNAATHGYTGMSVALPTVGIYWVGLWSSGTGELQGAAIQTGSRALLKLIAGADLTGGVATSNYYEQGLAYHATNPFPTAAPVATLSTNKHIPFCYFRYSA